jgi:hypothetical protein
MEENASTKTVAEVIAPPIRPVHRPVNVPVLTFPVRRSVRTLASINRMIQIKRLMGIINTVKVEKDKSCMPHVRNHYALDNARANANGGAERKRGPPHLRRRKLIHKKAPYSELIFCSQINAHKGSLVP